MNTVIDNIKCRRSIRKFLDKPIPKEIIETLIDAAIYAPSSHNSQPWNFTIISDREKIDEISDDIRAWYKSVVSIGKPLSFIKKVKKAVEEMEKRVTSERDLFFYKAPLVMIIHCKPGEFHVQDCAIAGQNIMLAARSLDIGSCWIGFADIVFNRSKKTRNKIGIPSSHRVMATIVLGYAEKFPTQALPRKDISKNWII